MNTQIVYRIGQISSITLWVLVIWSLLATERNTFQALVIWVGLGTIIIHAIEVLAVLVFGSLKSKLSAANVILTLLFGGFHLMQLKNEAK